MGWSCRADAMKTLTKIMETLCGKDPRTSAWRNTWQEGGQSYLFEAGRREHADGAITGMLYRMTDSVHAVRVGTFRIEGDGRLSRGPASWRRATAGG